MKEPNQEPKLEEVSCSGLVSKHVQLFEQLGLAERDTGDRQFSLFQELQPLCKRAEGRRFGEQASVNPCSKSADFLTVGKVAESINDKSIDGECLDGYSGPLSSPRQPKAVRCRSQSPPRTTDSDDLDELLCCSNLLVSAAEELAVAMQEDSSNESSTHGSTDSSFCLNCRESQPSEVCADVPSWHGSLSPRQERSPSEALLVTAVNDLLRAAQELNNSMDAADGGDDSNAREKHTSVDMEAALRAACQELVNDTHIALPTPSPKSLHGNATRNTSMRASRAKICTFASLQEELLATVCSRCHPQHTLSDCMRDWSQAHQRMAAILMSYCRTSSIRPCRSVAPPVTTGMSLATQSEALVTQASSAIVQLEEAYCLARSLSCPSTV